MKPQLLVAGLFTLGLCWVILDGPASQSQTISLPEGTQKEQRTSPTLDRFERFVRILQEEVDVSKLREPMPLTDVIAFLASVKKDQELPIFIDEADFRFENPDAPPVGETKVTFPATIKRMTRAAALRQALAALPTDNGTFIIRSDGIRITTLKAASLPYLSRQKVVGIFKAQPLDEVLRELSRGAGITLVVDAARVGEKLKMPVSATFTNNVSLKEAIELLADSVGLTCQARENAFFLTTPERISAIQKEKLEAETQHQKLLREALKLGPPDNNPNAGGNLGLQGAGFNPGGFNFQPGGFNFQPGGFNALGFNPAGAAGMVGVAPGTESPQDRWHWHGTPSNQGIPGL
jgi:hypothetical protein